MGHFLGGHPLSTIRRELKPGLSPPSRRRGLHQAQIFSSIWSKRDGHQRFNRPGKYPRGRIGWHLTCSGGERHCGPKLSALPHRVEKVHPNETWLPIVLRADWDSYSGPMSFGGSAGLIVRRSRHRKRRKPMTNMIEASGLVKRYKEVTALDGLDLGVPEGTVLGLLGPNGAGKTTAVSILTTLLEPDAGHGHGGRRRRQRRTRQASAGDRAVRPVRRRRRAPDRVREPGHDRPPLPPRARRGPASAPASCSSSST